VSNSPSRLFVKKSFILRGIDEIHAGVRSRQSALQDIDGGMKVHELLEPEIGEIPAQVVEEKFFGEDPDEAYWPTIPYKEEIAIEAYKLAHSFGKPVYTYLVRIHDDNDFTIQVTEEPTHVTVHVLTADTINDPDPPELNDEENSWVFGAEASVQKIADRLNGITEGQTPEATGDANVRKIRVVDYDPSLSS